MPMWDMSTGVRGNLAPAADSEHLPGLRREPAVVVQLITHRRDISRACGGTRRTAYPSAGGWDISRACGGTTGWAAAWAASRHSVCVAGRRRGRACAGDGSTRSCRTVSGAALDSVYQPEAPGVGAGTGRAVMNDRESRVAGLNRLEPGAGFYDGVDGFSCEHRRPCWSLRGLRCRLRRRVLAKAGRRYRPGACVR